MDGARLRFGFLNNHHVLMKRLSTTDVLPYVFSSGLVTEMEMGVIKHEITEGQKTDRLLSIIHRQGNTNPKVYVQFFELLSDDSVTGGQNLGKVLEQIQKDSQSEEVAKKFDYHSRLLEEEDHAALLKHKWNIVQSLSVEEILPELVALGAVSLSEKDEIMSEVTPNEQAIKLISVIQERGSSAYSDFISVLYDSDRHKHLGELLIGHREYSPVVPRSMVPVEEVLKRGHVPPRQGIYVERTDLIKKIRDALYKLEDLKEGWVLVHGIAGFGKTVLAAEAVRDAKILDDLFPGGVHWLTVGKLKDHRGDIDRAQLLSKLQTLILRLDKSNCNRQLPSVEAAKDYLQDVIREQYPKSLLILDDVWSYEVVNAFSVRCRILVTSRKAGLVSPVGVNNVFSVSVSDGFTEEEGKQLLAQWIDKTPEELSHYSDEILEHCRGSPMAIALIGAMLRKNSSEHRWKTIADKMVEKQLILKKELSSHPSLNASIELSIGCLSSEERDNFEMLSVFDYDIAIPMKVLETIWDVDELDAEENMNVLMDYSLTQKSSTRGSDGYSFYTIHDIILDYLKASISKEKQCDLHKLVVDRYRGKCDGAFWDLEDDSYIFRQLIGHIIESEDFTLLGDLLSQLKWLIANVCYGDANLLLAQYRDYKSKVPQTLEVDVRKFELFLSSHMFVLANSPKKDDIVQFALLQPDDSELYTQASFMIKGEERKKSWFKWINKESDPEKYVLKLKLHEEGISCCRFTKDGNNVLSCGGTEVKFWDASTGMVLSEFKGHTDRVTCCAIANTGRLIVTSSEDNTVKVWDPRTQRLVCDFTGHQYGVQCCSLSPDNKWVLSGDIDSVVILWDVLLGKVEKKWRLAPLTPQVLTPTNELSKPPDFLAPPTTEMPLGFVSQDSMGGGGGEGILSCAFSPDGTQFVTASQNGLIRLWDSNSITVKLTFHGHCTQVKCCVFSKTGSHLASASFDHTARVWDPATGDCTATLKHGDDVMVLCCDFSPDASRLITGDTSGSVKVWSLPHGILLNDLPLHWDYVMSVLYSPKTQNILSAADNGIIKVVWSEEIEEADKHPVQYHRRFSTHFLKEGSTYEPLVLCYVQKENIMQLVKGSKLEPVNPSLPTLPSANPRSWNFSNSGDMVAIGYVQSNLQLLKINREDSWSASQMWMTPNCHKKEILKVFFSPDNSKIASCCTKQHKIWSVKTGALISCVSGRGIGVKPLIFLEDNVRAVSIQETMCVLLWDSNTGSSIRKFEYNSGDHDTILCINISADNRRLVASATSGLVVVWSVDSGELLMQSTVTPLLSQCARSCALSPNGAIAVSGFDDGSLKIWNVATKREISHQYTGSQYWMIDVAVSPDGSKIVSLCDSIEWWNADGTHLKRVLLKGTFGKYIRFSPNFQTFVTIDNAGLLYILTSLT